MTDETPSSTPIGATTSRPDVLTMITSCPARRVLREQRLCLGVDEGNDQVMEVPGDDLGDPVGWPSPAHLAHPIADHLHPLVARAAEPERHLGQGAADDVAAAYQAVPVERRPEGERARPRDDGLVEVEERRDRRDGPLDGTGHDPAAYG